MPILLTMDYQQISSFNTPYGSVKTYARYYGQERDSNKTYYQLKTTYLMPQSGYYNSMSFANGYSILDGTQKNYGYTTFYRGETVLQELNREVTHNEDGSAPIRTVQTKWYDSYWGQEGTANADITFPDIQRYSVITKAEDFNDEEYPHIEFTNNGLYDLKAQMMVGDEIIYTGVVPSNRKYFDFILNNNKRNRLRQLCTGKSMDVKMQVISLSQSVVKYTSTKIVKMSIVGDPTFTYTASEGKILYVVPSRPANMK